MSAKEHMVLDMNENLLRGISAYQLAELGLLVEIILGLITWGEAESVGLALLLLASRGSIRLLMMRVVLRRGRPTARLAVVVVMVVVVMTALVVIETRTLLEVVIIIMEAPTPMMTSILLELSIVMLRRTGYRRRGGLGITCVRSWRVGTRTLVRSVWLRRVAIAHWSTRIPRRAAVKTHPDRRAHRLGFGSLAVVSSSTSGAAKLLVRLVLRRVGRSWGTPLLRRTTWLVRRRVRLSIWLLRRGAIGWLGLLRLLLTVGRLLLVEVLGVVGVVVLRGQGGLAGMLWVLRLPLIRPLLVLLRIATRARLGMLSWWVLRVLRSIRLGLVLRWLLGIAVRGWSMVVRSASCWLVVVATSSASSTTVSPPATSILLIWWVLCVACCRRRGRRSGRRRAVVVCHVCLYARMVKSWLGLQCDRL